VLRAGAGTGIEYCWVRYRQNNLPYLIKHDTDIGDGPVSYRFCVTMHIVIGTGNQQSTAQSQPNIRLAKYSGEARFSLQSLIDPETIGCAGEAASEQLMTLVRASVAAATWRKYESGWRAFCHFELDTETYYEWPLPPAAFRGFAVWCFCTKNLQPTTITAYVSAIKFAHRLKGLTAHDTKNDPVYQLIVTGARNLGFLQVPKPINRRVVTFPLLLALGHRIADTLGAVVKTGHLGGGHHGVLLLSQDGRTACHNPDYVRPGIGPDMVGCAVFRRFRHDPPESAQIRRQGRRIPRPVPLLRL